MVYELHDLYRSFPGRIALLLVDQVDNLEIEGEVRLQVGYRIASIICRQAVSNDLDGRDATYRCSVVIVSAAVGIPRTDAAPPFEQMLPPYLSNGSGK